MVATIQESSPAHLVKSDQPTSLLNEMGAVFNLAFFFISPNINIYTANGLLKPFCNDQHMQRIYLYKNLLLFF